MKMSRVVLGVALAAIMLGLGGCVWVSGDSKAKEYFVKNKCGGETLVNNVFTADGVPARKYLVGGGIRVYYQAPEAGTVYWVEENGRKIVMMEALDQDETFEESLQVENEEELKTFKELFGDLSQARFSLYFVPADDADDDEEAVEETSDDAKTMTVPAAETK